MSRTIGATVKLTLLFLAVVMVVMMVNKVNNYNSIDKYYVAKESFSTDSYGLTLVEW